VVECGQFGVDGTRRAGLPATLTSRCGHHDPTLSAGFLAARTASVQAAPVNLLRVWTYGLSAMTCEKFGEPQNVWWLAIPPDGRVARNITRNGLGYLPGDDRWTQWDLIRAVRTVTAISDRDDGDRRAHVLDLYGAGVVIAAYPHPGNKQPYNTLAAAMVTRVMPEVSSWWPLRGTVAWLGPMCPQVGMHVSLTPEQMTMLETLANSLRDKIRQRVTNSPASAGPPQSRRPAHGHTDYEPGATGCRKTGKPRPLP
jgi:hypothetical protein